MRAECAQKSLDTSRRAGYNILVSGSPLACGFSSSGRASASQAEGGEFEPRNPLHSQRQDVCSGAFLFWGFTMLPPRGSVVRPLCRGCFGERVTSSDGCGQKRHEKTTVRRHRGDPSRFKAALFFRRGTSSGGSFRNLTGFLSHPSCRFSQVRSPSADTCHSRQSRFRQVCIQHCTGMPVPFCSFLFRC